MSSGKLQGKTAIVTGADSGIGEAIAIEFAKEGANVVGTFHSDEEGGKSTERTLQKLGSKAIVLKLDVTSEQEIGKFFDKVFEEYESVDILVNNAGVNGSGIRLTDMDYQTFDLAIKTNLYGPFLMCRRFAQHRIEQGGYGKIINVTSVHEEIVALGFSNYDASKAGLKNFSRSIALELAAHNINVNNLAPGMFDTPMNANLQDEKERKKRSKAVPLQRPGEPVECGKLALFLASSDADYITGSSFFTDGGLRLKLGQDL